jgi:hypothetical protein
VAPLSHAAAAAFGEKALHKKDTCIGLVSGPDVSHWSVFLVGSRAWRVVVVFSPLPTLLFFLSNRPTHTHTTPTHFARRLWRHHCDQCAQWRLPPTPTFLSYPHLFYLSCPFFPRTKKPPKNKMADFYHFSFYNGQHRKPRPLPLVKYWRRIYDMAYPPYN